MGLRERLDRAAAMPHRNFAGDYRLDARLVSELGRLFFQDMIREAEYEAGANYAKMALLYLESIDAPSPFGGDLSPLSTDKCFARKMNFLAARDTLKSAGRKSVAVVDRVAIYDEPLRANELDMLRMGLRALSGL